MAKPKNAAVQTTDTSNVPPVTAGPTEGQVPQSNVKELKPQGDQKAPPAPQKLSVGRIVFYTPNRPHAKDAEPHVYPAIVTQIAKDGTASLTVFAANSIDRFHGVELGEPYTPGKCFWPPRV